MTGSNSADLVPVSPDPTLPTTPDPAAGAGAAPAGPRKRGRPRDPDADDRILDAAAHLMLSHGYDAMTVDDVAGAARVGKATVYRRFAKKEDLAVAAMRRLYGEEFPTPDTGSLRGDLTEVLTLTVQFAGSVPGAAYLRTAVTESSRDPQIAALYRAANAQAEAGAREMFARAAARGEVRADVNIDAAIQVVSGILLVRTVTRTPTLRLDEVDSLVDLLVVGVGS